METISPTRCVGCDLPGQVLCPDCSASLPFIDPASACPRCGAPHGRIQCTECPIPGSEEALAHPEESFPFAEARCAVEFEGIARRIVTTYKDKDELRLDAVIAELLCAVMRGRRVNRETELAYLIATGAFPDRAIDLTTWADALVCVPASPEAKLRRGFDHMMRIGELCSSWTGLPLIELLSSRKGVSDQRRLGRAERIENRTASFAFTCPSDGPVPRRVVLIDDVLTTGATLSAAAQVLLDAGVHEVRVVTCCRVW